MRAQHAGYDFIYIEDDKKLGRRVLFLFYTIERGPDKLSYNRTEEWNYVSFLYLFFPSLAVERLFTSTSHLIGDNPIARTALSISFSSNPSSSSQE